MEIVGQFAVLVHPLAVLGPQHELLVEAVAVRRLVVGIGDVVDRHRLRTVLLADPVGIRKVDADRRRRVAVPAQHRYGDHLRRDALHLLLAVLRVHGRVVLEPLRIRRNRLRAVAGRRIHEVHDRLPRSLEAQRIAVGLDEAVHEIDVRDRIPNPTDVIAVELLQVAAPVVGDQCREVRLLRLLRHRFGLFQPVDDPLDGRRIHAADLPRPLDEFPGVVLHQLAVQPVGDRFGVPGVGGRHPRVEALGLRLRNAPVVVARRGEQQVVARPLVQPRGVGRRVEDRPAHRGDHRLQVAEPLHGDRLAKFQKIALRELRRELVVRIVVVDAVGEPHLFQILLQSLPFGRRAVPGVVFVNHFKGPAHRQVHDAVLVVENVPAALRSLRKIIDQFLLFERQRLETRYFVTDDLDVVEAVDDPRRRTLRRVAARGQCGNHKCHGYKRKKPFHAC